MNKLSVADGPIKLKPGRYYVGDPCYVYPEGEWGDFCGVSLSNDHLKYGRVYFFSTGTAYGDGEYHVRNKGEIVGSCGVDAGMLAVIPESLVKKWNHGTPEWRKKVGVFVDLEKEAIVKLGSRGNFEFGPFTVITDGSDNDEDEDECCPHCGR